MRKRPLERFFDALDEALKVVSKLEEGKWYSIVVDSEGNIVITDEGMEKALEIFEKKTCRKQGE